MEKTFQRNYLLPIKILPWIFWTFILGTGIMLYLNAWKY